MPQAANIMSESVATADRVETLRLEKQILIEAPPAIVFESILEEMGPGMTLEDGSSMRMKVEPWPGGRWYRDLGDGAGHLWGHVQVIKPPALLEICGPLFMSYPAISHVQYRVAQEGNTSRLKILHRAIGLIDPKHAAGVSEGWEGFLNGVRTRAAGRAASAGNR